MSRWSSARGLMGRSSGGRAKAATAVAADVKKNRHYLRKGAIGVGVAGAGTAGYGYIKHRGSQNKSITNNPNGIYG